MAREERPIPSFVCEDVRFAEHLDALVAQAGLDLLSDWDRLQMHKRCIREAAMRTRDDMLKEEHSALSKDLILTTIARALWHNDLGLAKT
eukprot:465709-Karenia_brevis.AAC.1